MRYDRGTVTDMQGKNPFLNVTVSLGDTFMVTQMGKPGIFGEILQITAWLRDIFKQSPRVCAVASALGFEFVHYGDEGGTRFEFYPIFDGHKNRAAIRFDFTRNKWFWPV